MGGTGHRLSLSRLLDNSLPDHPYAATAVAEHLVEGFGRSQWLQGLALHTCDNCRLLVSARLSRSLLEVAYISHQGVLRNLYPLLLHPDLRRFLRCPERVRDIPLANHQRSWNTFAYYPWYDG